MRLICLALMFCLLLLSGRVLAAQSNEVRTDHDVVTLVSRSDSFVAGEAVALGLRLRLAPGWHTYWSNPGDAGEAPTIQVSIDSAADAAASIIDWPAPERLPDGPLMSYGYTGDTLLPVTLAPKLVPRAGAAGTLHLVAHAQWLACANVCVPESGTFRLDLPQSAAGHLSGDAPLFTAAQARQPVPSPFPASVQRDGSDRLILSLSGAGLSTQSVHDAWFFPASPGVINQIAPQKVSIVPGAVRIALAPAAAVAKAPGLEGLVVLRDAAGNESYLSVRAQPITVASAWAGVPRLLLFALLGGIVLNLMPCVFPVLAMKALALARMSDAGGAERRMGAAFYTAGVMVAFAALGGLMLGLRAAGSSVGWGFQFQSAIFVAGTCWLLFAVGLNLTGLFEVGARITGLGQGMTARGGHRGDFATGLLAVLVATPCTAPFMGAAIAGALAAPAIVGIAVFLAMGLGLALPYGMIALWPGLAARLPRPGAWMELLRQALSFPVFASCAWLAWVAAIEGGDQAVLILASGLVLLALAGWLYGLSQRMTLRRPVFVLAASGLCVVAALALLPGLAGARAQRVGPGGGLAAAGSEPFSESRLAGLRAERRPVFVDMTAAWCVTCLVNERVALSPASVQAAFAAHHVAYLKGDWTRRDEAISGFLRAHGRDGVPFYIYYSPGGEGTVLPQILTADRVLHAIDPPPEQDLPH